MDQIKSDKSMAESLGKHSRALGTVCVEHSSKDVSLVLKYNKYEPSWSR